MYDDSLESWVYAATQLYKKGYSYKKIKEMLGGSKADLDSLKDYLHANKIGNKFKIKTKKYPDLTIYDYYNNYDRYLGTIEKYKDGRQWILRLGYNVIVKDNKKELENILRRKL